MAKRSIFHHFADMEALLAEAGRTQLDRYWNVLQVPSGGPLGERLAVAMDQRAHLFESIVDVRRVASLYEGGSPALGRAISPEPGDVAPASARLLDPEYSRVGRDVRDGVYAMASWEAWEVLRRHQRLSVNAAKAAVHSTIEAALERA